MINLFNKLKRDGLLKTDGKLLDLGAGNGQLSEPFCRHGYQVELVDKDKESLNKADILFKKIEAGSYKITNSNIEDFAFEPPYAGIIASMVLHYRRDKQSLAEFVNRTYAALEAGGFLYFTLLGNDDQWAQEYAETMSFYGKEESLQIIPVSPYFFSEDYGKGSTMKGTQKVWHILHLLYIKGS